jgi:hypothetical protein
MVHSKRLEGSKCLACPTVVASADDWGPHCWWKAPPSTRWEGAMVVHYAPLSGRQKTKTDHCWGVSYSTADHLALAGHSEPLIGGDQLEPWTARHWVFAMAVAKDRGSEMLTLSMASSTGRLMDDGMGRAMASGSALP